MHGIAKVDAEVGGKDYGTFNADNEIYLGGDDVWLRPRYYFDVSRVCVGIFLSGLFAAASLGFFLGRWVPLSSWRIALLFKRVVKFGFRLKTVRGCCC